VVSPNWRASDLWPASVTVLRLTHPDVDSANSLGHDQYLKFLKLLPVLKHHEALPVVSFFEKRTDAHHPWHRRLQPPIAREPGTEEACVFVRHIRAPHRQL